MKFRTALIAGLVFTTLLSCQKKLGVEDLLSDDPDVRGKALTQLIQIENVDRDALIPLLIKKLRSSNSRRVDRAVDALSVIGDPAIPFLTPLLKDDDRYVRISATLVLGLIGEPAHAALPDFIVLLEDPHPLVRDEAARTIGFMGSHGTQALPALKKALTDENKAVRDNAKEAIKRIEAATSTTSPGQS